MKNKKEIYGYYIVYYNEDNKVYIEPVSTIYYKILEVMNKFEGKLKNSLGKELNEYIELLLFIELDSNAKEEDKLNLLYKKFPKRLLTFIDVKSVYQQLGTIIKCDLKIKRIIIEDIN